MSVLREAFIDELKDLLDAERQLLKALPKMEKAAENDQLRAAFEQHEQETRLRGLSPELVIRILE
jgi:ferritin-like metal-binding protein YciE